MSTSPPAPPHLPADADATQLRAVINQAQQFFLTVMQGHAPLENLYLEEISRAESEDWLIVFGYERPTSNRLSKLGVGAPSLSERVYREVRIDARTLQPLAIKILEP